MSQSLHLFAGRLSNIAITGPLVLHSSPLFAEILAMACPRLRFGSRECGPAS
jgi:hypothetical protein